MPNSSMSNIASTVDPPKCQDRETACGSPSKIAREPDPLGSIRSISTTLRQDLQITRTTNRGTAVYMVFDPLSFRSHRLTLHDYTVVARISADRTLGECFDDCVRDSILGRSDEEQFYRFIEQLASLGLLTLHWHDPKQLYDRFNQLKSSATKSKIFGFLFLKLPLSNPDKFLDRSVGRFRFLFSAPVVVTWLIGMIVVFSIVATRWDSFFEPLNGMLAVKNLVFLGVAFIGLKVWHELGHGYACKMFGGRVPEMGCKLIVGMPLAYVDASSAWSFPRRRDRIIVMLGGMYFELLLVVPATLIWAYWPYTVLGSFSYQIVFMAGIATILFNINPLMKFDGYFILSDLIGIANLRSRATHEVKRQLKARVLGISTVPTTANNRRDLFILLVYGVSATVYGWMLMLSIAGLLATRFHVVGMFLAAGQLGFSTWRVGKQLFVYLWHDKESASVRIRSKRVGLGIAVVMPLLIALLPVPIGATVLGVVTAAKSTRLRVATPGFLEAVLDPPPETVEAGQTLVTMRNIDIDTDTTVARLNESTARRAMHRMTQITPADGARQLQTAITEGANRVEAEKVQQELTIRAPHDGRLASLLPKQSVGTFLQTGEVVAHLVAGSAQVRAWLNEEQLAIARLEVGREVRLRIANDPTRTYKGTIHSVAPANKSQFEDISLTTIGEGTIPYNPITGETLERVFQLLIDVPALDSQQTLQGLSATVRIDRRYESLGGWVIRQTYKFVNSLFASVD